MLNCDHSCSKTKLSLTAEVNNILLCPLSFPLLEIKRTLLPLIPVGVNSNAKKAKKEEKNEKNYLQQRFSPPAHTDPMDYARFSCVTRQRFA